MFITNNYGKQNLMDGNGYMYQSNRVDRVNGRHYWVCALRNRLRCYGRAVTIGGYVAKWSGTHSHPP